MSEQLARITPVQLRGVGAIERPEDERGVVRVRIRTRGNLDRELRIRDPIPLAGIVAMLRDDVGGMPLNIVAVADDLTSASPAVAFVQQLAALGGDRLDARWLATRKRPGDAASVPATVLNLESSGRDQHIFRNLVADLLFVSGTGKADVEAVESFAHRAPIVVVPHDGAALEAFGPAAAAADVAVLTWRADNGEIGAPMPDKLWPGSLFPQRGSESDGEWREVVARRLGDIAAQLNVREDRRIRFRDILAEAAQTDPMAGPDALIPLADALSWPRWAVETLPKRYVRRQSDDGLVQAFVWKVLVDCIAGPVKIEGKLCGGAVFDLRVAENFAMVLEELDRAIETFVTQMPHAGDQVFFTAVACALEQVANRADTDPGHAARMRSVSWKLGSSRT